VKAAATLPENQTTTCQHKRYWRENMPQTERQKAGTLVKAPVPNPDVKQPTVNTNAAGVKTLPQPERQKAAQ